MSNRNRPRSRRPVVRSDAVFGERLEPRRLFSTVVVNTVADQIDPAGSSIVSLRDAIAVANSATSPTSIVFSTKMFASHQTITLTLDSRLSIQTAASTDTVTITAPAAGLTIDGNNKTGDFVIFANSTADLTGLTLINGKSTNGAGLDDYGTVTLTDSTVSGNSSPNGGGVFVSGDAFLIDDTVSANTGTTGGGVWVTNSGYLSLTNTTIANNTGQYGGGIYAGGTEPGSVQLHNATISGNSASFGGGVYSTSNSSVGLGNTLIAGNKRTSTGTSGTDVSGAFTSRGYDLIGNADGGTGFVSTDLVGHSATPLNAKLGSLANNGGPTATLLPQLGSPVIGAGSVALISYESTDQRGLPRVVNNAVDIGAVQTQPSTATAGSPVAVSPGTATSPGTVLTTDDPTFTWKPVTGETITGYQVHILNQALNTITSYNVGPNTTTFTPPVNALTPSELYVWNVRTVDGNATGAPSNYLYFQTPAKPVLTAPVAVAPGTGTSPGPVLTTTTPTFTWKAVTGITLTGYQINLYDQTLSKSFSYQVGASTTTYTVAAGTLAAGDSFVWNVRVLDGSASGPPSNYLYFQTPAAHALTAPVAVSPGTATSPGPVITTTSPTFTWKAVTGETLTGYKISLYDLTSSKSFSYTVGASTTQYTVPADTLTSGDSFVWNVRVLDGSTSGPPSNYLYFQTTPAADFPAPVVSGPGSTTAPGPVITTVTPTFTWKAVTGFTFDNYQLNLYDYTTQQFQEILISPTATSYTAAAGILHAGDSYVWNLRLKVGTVTGPESAYLNFRTE